MDTLREMWRLMRRALKMYLEVYAYVMREAWNIATKATGRTPPTTKLLGYDK